MVQIVLFTVSNCGVLDLTLKSPHCSIMSSFSCKYRKKSFISTYGNKYIVVKEGFINVYKTKTHHTPQTVIELTNDSIITREKENKHPYILSIKVGSNTYLFSFFSKQTLTEKYQLIIDHKFNSQLQPISQSQEQQHTHLSMKPPFIINDNQNDMISAYGGSVTNKSPYSIGKQFWKSHPNNQQSRLRLHSDHKETKSDDADDYDYEYKDNLYPPITTALRYAIGNNSISIDCRSDALSMQSSLQLSNFDSDKTMYGESTKRTYIGSNIKSSHVGYYKFEDDVITVANIIDRDEEARTLTLQCKLIGRKEEEALSQSSLSQTHYLRQPFVVNKNDKRICDLNKNDIEASHQHIWEKWMIILNAKYNYQSGYFDGDPFKIMINAIKRHPQLLFTFKYDNYREKLEQKKYDHLLKSLFSYLLSIECQNHDNSHRIKLNCNCYDAKLFTKYSYYLLMAIIKDKYDKFLKENNILVLLKRDGRQNTLKSAEEISKLLPKHMQNARDEYGATSYFNKYQQYILEWLNFDFYSFVCSKCECLNNTIMIKRLFHYASKTINCRICGAFLDSYVPKHSSKPLPYVQSLFFAKI